MHRWTIVLLTPCLFTTGHVTADEDLPAGTPNEEFERRVEQQQSAKIPVDLIPVVSLKGDLRSLLKAKEYVKELQVEGATDATMFELVEFTDELPSLPDQTEPRTTRIEAYLASAKLGGDISMAMDLILPGDKQALLDVLGGDAETEIVQQDEGVVMMGGIPCVATERYFGIPQMDDEHRNSDNEIERLQKLLRETEEERLTKTMSISSRPKEIGRSQIGPILQAYRATLLTQAQRRDEEDDGPYLARSVLQKSMVALFDLLFQEVEQLEYSYTFAENDKSSDIQMRVETTKGSAASRYIRSLQKKRNRSLGWLHPKQQLFASASLPIPELLRKSLPDLSRLVLTALHEQLPQTSGPNPVFERVLRQFVEEERFEFLCQTIPVSDDAMATFVVIPLTSASSLESATIQLINATESSSFELNIGDAGGWPVHAFSDGPEFLSDITDEEEFLWVLTDDCLVISFGGDNLEDWLSMLEEIVTRDFEPPPEAERFSRVSVALQTTALHLGKTGLIELPKVLEQRVIEDSTTVLDDSILVTLQPEGDAVSLKATFQRDAIAPSIITFEVGIELLLDPLDDL